jgi:hypothetical protein
LKRFGTFVTVCLAAGLLAVEAGAGTGDLRERDFLSTARLAAPAEFFTTRTLAASDLELPRSFMESGGVYNTRDGIAVRVIVSDSYIPNPAADQALVDFLGALVHGAELGRLTAAVVAPDELKAICGGAASGCYSPSLATLVVAGEAVDGIPAEHVLTHEYGHHVATNRDNSPWDAVDWGTKRWATHMNICARVQAGHVFPGNEAERYRLNPGEGFAEVYRVVNANRIGGWAEFGWHVVDPLFLPDATALALLEQDVLQPWTAPTTRRVTGRLAARKSRLYGVSTPLDGAATATLTGPAGSAVRFVTTAGRAITPWGRRASVVACGGRQLKAAVRTGKRPGTFKLTLSTP